MHRYCILFICPLSWIVAQLCKLSTRCRCTKFYCSTHRKISNSFKRHSHLYANNVLIEDSLQAATKNKSKPQLYDLRYQYCKALILLALNFADFPYVTLLLCLFVFMSNLTNGTVIAFDQTYEAFDISATVNI